MHELGAIVSSATNKNRGLVASPSWAFAALARADGGAVRRKNGGLVASPSWVIAALARADGGAVRWRASDELARRWLRAVPLLDPPPSRGRPCRRDGVHEQGARRDDRLSPRSSTAGRHGRVGACPGSVSLDRRRRQRPTALRRHAERQPGDAQDPPPAARHICTASPGTGEDRGGGPRPHPNPPHPPPPPSMTAPPPALARAANADDDERPSPIFCLFCLFCLSRLFCLFSVFGMFSPHSEFSPRALAPPVSLGATSEDR